MKLKAPMSVTMRSAFMVFIVEPLNPHWFVSVNGICVSIFQVLESDLSFQILSIIVISNVMHRCQHQDSLLVLAVGWNEIAAPWHGMDCEAHRFYPYHYP